MNINDQAQTNTDCVETGAYGTNDTITIPEGKVLLTANTPALTSAVTIQGSGMDQTIIDGGGQYVTITHGNSTDFTIKKLRIEGYTDFAISSNGGNVSIDQVEVDGSSATFSSNNQFAIFLQNSQPSASTMKISNSYVHDIGTSNNGGTLQSVILVSKSAAVNTALVENVTVANIYGGGVATAVSIGSGFVGGGTGSMNATVRNTTISNVHASSGPASGITPLSFGVTNETHLAVESSTITNLSGVDIGFGYTNAGIGAATVSSDPNQQTHSDVTVVNSILDGQCATVDIGSLVIGPGAGTGAQSITSHGGNLSSDNSCKDYFTQSTDQNNVGNLASTLGTLSNNGGYVPTIPLMQGSPAIDAGVNVSGLTTDARLAARPQGTAFDSGAYESPYSKPTLASTGENLTALMTLVGLLLSVGTIFLMLSYVRSSSLTR